MMFTVDSEKQFEYENGFYLTAQVSRFSKFVTHLDFYRRVMNLSGHIVECGVFKGASLMRFIKLRSLIENAFSRKIIGFDTFGEFPEPEYEPDKKIRSMFIEESGTSSSITKDYFNSLLDEQNLNQNIELIEGNVLETIPAYLEEFPQLKIALLNVDVDLYESTLICLERFYPHVVKGGIIILDDYGALPGANKAIDEFFADKDTPIMKLPLSYMISYVVKD